MGGGGGVKSIVDTDFMEKLAPEQFFSAEVCLHLVKTCDVANSNRKLIYYSLQVAPEYF